MEKKAYIKILIAASLWGCIGIFLKLLTAAGLSTMQGVAIRALFATVAYVVFLLFTNPNALKIDPRHWYYFFGTGVCSLLFFNWCYFNAIVSSSMSVAAVLLYTAPMFVTVMSAFFFKEAITKKKLAALAITFGGCILVTGLFPIGQQSLSVSTIAFGLGSGFCYALYSILGKFALEKYSSYTVSFYTIFFCALVSTPISGLFSNPLLLLDWRVIVGGMGVGFLCCALPYFLYTDGLQHAQPGKASIMATIELFVASVLGIFLYHETVTVYKLLGMAAIFCAILMLNLSKKQVAA